MNEESWYMHYIYCTYLKPWRFEYHPYENYGSGIYNKVSFFLFQGLQYMWEGVSHIFFLQNNKQIYKYFFICVRSGYPFSMVPNVLSWHSLILNVLNSINTSKLVYLHFKVAHMTFYETWKLKYAKLKLKCISQVLLKLFRLVKL